MADWTSRKEYFDAVRSIAQEAVDEAEDDDQLSDFIHESVDGSEWVIYTAGNIGVLQFSDADLELPIDEFGEEFIQSADSISGLLAKMAYVYLESDVRDHAQPLWDDKLETLDA